VSPDFAGPESDWSRDRVEVLRRPFEREDLRDAFLVFAATDDETVNRRIASEARALGIMVQQVDSPDSSDFTFPATLRRGDLTVSFATNGAIPALSAYLKQEAADRFGEGYADFCRLARAFRRDAIQEFSPRMREDFLKRLLDSDVLDLLSRGEKKAAYQRANNILVEFRSGSRHETTGVFSPREPLGVDRLGKVYLIGAGPGDPGLLTVKGAECLRSADTVLYDGMVDPILLDLYCAEAEQIDVSKRKGQCTRTQEEIIASDREGTKGTHSCPSKRRRSPGLCSWWGRGDGASPSPHPV